MFVLRPLHFTTSAEAALAASGRLLSESSDSVNFQELPEVLIFNNFTYDFS